MELVGMKGGVPQYETMGKVYGESPRDAAIPAYNPLTNQSPVPSPASAMQGRTELPARSAQEIRDSFQTGSTAAAVRQQGAPRPESRFRRPGAPAGPGPASQPATAYKSPTEGKGAFSRERYAKTAEVQQSGWEQKAIREGRASDATKAKHKQYAADWDAGRKMDAEIAKGQSYGGEAPKVGGPGFHKGSKVVSIRPGGSRFRRV
jgi:hypothetical protein